MIVNINDKPYTIKNCEIVSALVPAGYNLIKPILKISGTASGFSSNVDTFRGQSLKISLEDSVTCWEGWVESLYPESRDIQSISIVCDMSILKVAQSPEESIQRFKDLKLNADVHS